MKKYLLAALCALLLISLCLTAFAVSLKGPFIYVEGGALRVGYDENNPNAGKYYVYQLLNEQGQILLMAPIMGNNWFPEWSQSGVYKARVYYADAQGNTRQEESDWTNVVLSSSTGGYESAPPNDRYDPDDNGDYDDYDDYDDRDDPYGSYEPYDNSPRDMGIPQLNGRVYNKDNMNMVVFWVQTQLKATGIYYRGEQWDVTGNLGSGTMTEIKAFMRAHGYGGHSGRVDQAVVDALVSDLGSHLVPVYVGGFYDEMDSIMQGGSSGSMTSIVSNLRDMVPRVTIGARWAQCCLMKLGYYNDVIDGKYGEGTERAVKAFQRDHRFEQRDYITLGVARAMLEACYANGCDLSDLP